MELLYRSRKLEEAYHSVWLLIYYVECRLSMDVAMFGNDILLYTVECDTS
jgi:hypothetical protein